MSAEHQYFYEDEVFRINKKGVIEFGMVLENSELVSSDDDSDVEESGKMKKGHIRVAWHPTGEEEVLPEKKVGLADRSLMPGDVVRRMIKGKDTQRGYCRDIKVTACLQVLGTKRVIMNVKSEDLVPLEEFAADIAVCLDSWVGGIKMAQSKLVLQFSDGSRCKVTDPEAFGFDVFDDKRDSGCEFPHRGDYYPGQVLWGPLHALQDAQWLHCSKELHSMLSRPNKTVKVMVESLETKSVTVHWQCRAYSKDGEGGGGGGGGGGESSSKEQPTAVVCGDKLKQMKLLNVFEPCTLQVGDRNFYTLGESDQVATKEQWRKAQKDAVVNSLFSAVEPPTYIPPLTPHYAPKRRHKRQANLANRASQHPKYHETHDDRGSVPLTTLWNANSLTAVVVDNATQTCNSNGDDKVTTTTTCDKVTSENSTSPAPTQKAKEDEEKDKEDIPSANQTCDKVDSEQTTNLLTSSSKPSDGPPQVKLPANNSTKGDDWETDSGSDVDYGSDTGSNMSSSTASSSAGSTAGRGLAHRKTLALMTKMLKKKSLRRARKKLPPVVLIPGTRLAVETLSTASSADVVWQDGSVEYGIPSTQLYPIHHLDDQEFFPGDFVIENHDDTCMRVYGVVQSVDHAGRTARVNWFRTYASADDPKPTLLQKSEVSVYDLKDHPDFQYRPGTVVIRVANFEGEDANCTAGQVLDNYPEGRVRVWWVDGHISMCWPQDLYKVGEYDSDEGELWDDSSSEASWETESEVYCIADEFVTEETDAENLKPKLAANIEKARIAMSRLEEIFTHNPALQTTDVMRKLLEVYKDCRYLDKLMGTTFFHECHFQGLLERVRERGRANVAQRVADQVSRLFNQPDSQSAAAAAAAAADRDGRLLQPANGIANHLSAGFETETQMSERSSNSDSGVVDGSPPNNKDMIGEFLTENLASLEQKVLTAANNSRNAAASAISDNIKLIVNQSSCDTKINDESGDLPQVVETSDKEPATKVAADAEKSSADAAEKSPLIADGAGGELATSDELVTGGGTACELADRLGCTNSTAAPPAATDKSCCELPPPASDADESATDQPTPTVCNSHVCVKLCSLILAQLVKAHTEVMRRYGGNTTGGMTLSDAANTVSPAGSSERDAADPPQTPDELIADADTKEGADESEPPAAAVNGTTDSGAATLTSPCTTPVKETESVLAAQSSCNNLQKEGEGFSILETAPISHKFKLTMFLPNDQKTFFKTVRNEIKLLRTSLPQGIWVKGFEDRMDLYSVMIRGPEKTPYEDGLFFFDFQLSADYPKAPPLCHYVSYCSDRLNPNLYEDGKVCVSLLGTWSGKGTEVWTLTSNLLQVIVSIQGLILVSEPYFNEAGYEKQKGSQQGRENSRMYNEMVVLKLVQSMTKLINHPPPIFKEQITEHFTKNAPKLISRLNSWLEVSERYNDSHPLSPTTPNSFKEIHSTNEAIPLPEFPLIPASKGFCLTLRKSLATFTETLSQSLETERKNSTVEVDACS